MLLHRELPYASTEESKTTKRNSEALKKQSPEGKKNRKIEAGGDQSPGTPKKDKGVTIGRQRPDATIGLCSFALNGPPWTTGRFASLKEEHRVKYLDRSLLRQVFGEVTKLQPPYSWDGEGDDARPLFGFALYEAKKRAAVSLESALDQSRPKLKELYSRQRDLFRCASLQARTARGKRRDEVQEDSLPFSPVVWSFASAGSEWILEAMFGKNNDTVSSPRMYLA